MKAPFATMDDFPDRLNPYLVKELRCALRGRSFVSPFITLHVVVMILLMQRLQVSPTGWDTCDVMLLLTAVVTLHLMVVCRQIWHGDEDATPGNLELLRCLPCSHDALVWSKFLTSQALMALGFVTLIPYWLLRYFIGGVEVGSELAMVVAFLMNGLLLSVVGVVASSCAGVGWRMFWLTVLLFLTLLDLVTIGLVGAWAKLGSGLGGAIAVYTVCYLVVAMIMTAAMMERYLMDSEIDFPLDPSLSDAPVSPVSPKS
jgi:hypothetical protein